MTVAVHVSIDFDFEVRERILEAAERLGDERGEGGITMRHLAACAGVATTALYQTFGSKASLLRELKRRFRAQHDAGLARAFARASDPATRLFAICVAHVEFARAAGWRYAVAFEPSEPAATCDDCGPSVGFLACAGTCCPDSGFESTDSTFEPPLDGTGLRLWVAVHGLASAVVNHGLARNAASTVESNDRFIDEYLRMLLRGVGIEQGATRAPTDDGHAATRSTYSAPTT